MIVLLSLLSSHISDSSAICHECDLLVSIGQLPEGYRASCPRCGFVFTRSVSNALELLISDVVVSVGVWSWSVDALFSGDEVGWLVDSDGFGGCNSSEGDD